MKKTYQKLFTTLILISSFIFLCGANGCNIYAISGTVDGDIQSGVTITLSGDLTTTTTTSSDGSYILDWLANGRYTITPSKNGYTFDPASEIITVSDNYITGVDFTGTMIPLTSLISGTVSGDVQEGVTVTLSGDNSDTTTTDSNGDYFFGGITDGNYTITPTHSDYIFSPTRERVTVDGADETEVNFDSTEVILVYTYTISGTVSGDIQSGVTMTLSGDNSDTTTTNLNGDYSFSGFENGSYTITPSKGGYTFSPTSEGLTVSNADETGVDFTAALETCDDVDRFLDNNDGTVTDCRTSLVWLQNASSCGYQNWITAMATAAGLNSGECGLTDGSEESDWRLPTKEELQGIGTDPPTAWTMPGSPFVSVQSSLYWSSTEYYTSNAWNVHMDNGIASLNNKTYSSYVWPVRSDN